MSARDPMSVNQAKPKRRKASTKRAEPISEAPPAVQLPPSNQTERFTLANGRLLRWLKDHGNQPSVPGRASLLELAVFRAEQRLRMEAVPHGER